MPSTYEYLPPHGRPTSKPAARKQTAPLTKVSWDVSIPWGPETIRKSVLAVDERKAFNIVVMEMSRNLNVPASRIFQRVNAEKKYTVTKTKTDSTSSTFASRAAGFATADLDIARIIRLPYVERAILYERNGNRNTYQVFLRKGNTLNQSRELTGYLQTLFGGRLLSSGQTQVSDKKGESRSVVELRVSMLELV